MDASYKAEISKHSSVLDNKVGFGGKYGVQTDRQDKVSQIKGELRGGGSYSYEGVLLSGRG